MQFVDLVRYAVLALFGAGLGFMVVTNVLAFLMLRPPKHLGLLWWRLASVSLSFVCIGVVAVDRVVTKIGDPVGWQSLLVFVGMALYLVAQVIIFNVERQRLVVSRAQNVAAAVDRKL